MTRLELTAAERFEIQFVLPAQGSIKNLELVKTIFEKIEIFSIQGNESDDVKHIEFEDEEIALMQNTIHALDESQRLRYSSLELAKKILRS